MPDQKVVFVCIGLVAACLPRQFHNCEAKVGLFFNLDKLLASVVRANTGEIL